MFYMASTTCRYYLYAKNKKNKKIQYGGKVMAPFKKTQKIEIGSYVLFKAG